ncbi:putative Ubiquitin carboxyl-terminal hydrolase [Blattamonas nauphoetae]|uniref:Ubiquitin carboxyl-terminal hydrolase n=1 Tax=Blattamonas nauphoetae TaxID=2049346 RepID=A0ABQ9Y6G8_9EUKA|nr:putative Ubiquitin carboxyl-terminal hydrolase [Blattamonas nauphoetae]
MSLFQTLTQICLSLNISTTPPTVESLNLVYHLLKPIVFSTFFCTRQLVAQCHSMVEPLNQFLSSLSHLDIAQADPVKVAKRIFRLYFLFERLLFATHDPNDSIPFFQKHIVYQAHSVLTRSNAALQIALIHLLYPIFLSIADDYAPKQPSATYPDPFTPSRPLELTAELAAGVHTIPSLLSRGKVVDCRDLFPETTLLDISQTLRQFEYNLSHSDMRHIDIQTRSMFFFIRDTLFYYFAISNTPLSPSSPQPPVRLPNTATFIAKDTFDYVHFQTRPSHNAGALHQLSQQKAPQQPRPKTMLPKANHHSASVISAPPQQPPFQQQQSLQSLPLHQSNPSGHILHLPLRVNLPHPLQMHINVIPVHPSYLPSLFNPLLHCVNLPLKQISLLLILISILRTISVQTASSPPSSTPQHHPQPKTKAQPKRKQRITSYTPANGVTDKNTQPSMPPQQSLPEIDHVSPPITNQAAFEKWVEQVVLTDSERISDNAAALVKETFSGQNGDELLRAIYDKHMTVLSSRSILTSTDFFRVQAPRYPRHLSNEEKWNRFSLSFWTLFDAMNRVSPFLNEEGVIHLILGQPFTMSCLAHSETASLEFTDFVELIWSNVVLVRIFTFLDHLHNTDSQKFSDFVSRIIVGLEGQMKQVQETTKPPSTPLPSEDELLLVNIAAFLTMLFENKLVQPISLKPTKFNKMYQPKSQQEDRLTEWELNREEYIREERKRLDDEKAQRGLSQYWYKFVSGKQEETQYVKINNLFTYQDLRKALAKRHTDNNTAVVHLKSFGEDKTTSTDLVADLGFNKDDAFYLKVSVHRGNPIPIVETPISLPDHLKDPPQQQLLHKPLLPQLPNTLSFSDSSDSLSRLVSSFNSSCYLSSVILSSVTALITSLKFSSKLHNDLSHPAMIPWNVVMSSVELPSVLNVLERVVETSKRGQTTENETWISEFLRAGGLKGLFWWFLLQVKHISTSPPSSPVSTTLVARALKILQFMFEKGQLLTTVGSQSADHIETVFPEIPSLNRNEKEEPSKLVFHLAVLTISLRQLHLLIPFSSFIDFEKSSQDRIFLHTSTHQTPKPGNSVDLFEHLSSSLQTPASDGLSVNLLDHHNTVQDSIQNHHFDQSLVDMIRQWNVGRRIKPDETDHSLSQAVMSVLVNPHSPNEHVLSVLFHALPSPELLGAILPGVIISSSNLSTHAPSLLTDFITDSSLHPLMKEQCMRLLLHILFVPTEGFRLDVDTLTELISRLVAILTDHSEGTSVHDQLALLASSILIASSHKPLQCRFEQELVSSSYTPIVGLLHCLLHRNAGRNSPILSRIQVSGKPLAEYLFTTFISPKFYLHETDHARSDIHIVRRHTRTQLFDVITALITDDTDTSTLWDNLAECERSHLETLIPFARSLENSGKQSLSRGLQKGLTNPRNACFMNSVIIQLFHHQQFRNTILSFSPPFTASDQLEKEDLSETVPRNTFVALRRLFTELAWNDPAVSTTVEELTKYISAPDGSSFSVHKQDDASDFFQAFGSIDQYLENTGNQPFFQKLFCISTVSHIICPNGDFSHEPEESYVVRLPVAAHSRLIDCLAEKALGQEQKGLSFCVKCRQNFPSLHQAVTFSNTSNTLVLYVVRNVVGSQYSLNWDRVDIPFDGLDITPFTEENRQHRRKERNGEADRFKKIESLSGQMKMDAIHEAIRVHPSITKEEWTRNLFDLAGFVTFLGHPDQGGHYRSYVRGTGETRRPEHREGGGWLRFDDDKVTEVSFDEAKTAAEGCGKDGCEYGFLLFFQRRFPEQTWAGTTGQVQKTFYRPQNERKNAFPHFEMGDVLEEQDELALLRDTPIVQFEVVNSAKRTIAIPSEIQQVYDRIEALKKEIEESYALPSDRLGKERPLERSLFNKEMEDPLYSEFLERILPKAIQTESVIGLTFAQHFFHTTLRTSPPGENLDRQKRIVKSALSNFTASQQLIECLTQQMNDYLTWLKQDTDQKASREAMRNQIQTENALIVSLRDGMKTTPQQVPHPQPKTQNRFGSKLLSAETKKKQTEMDEQIQPVSVPAEKSRNIFEEFSTSLVVSFLFHCADERQNIFFECVKHALNTFTSRGDGEDNLSQLTQFYSSFMDVIASGITSFFISQTSKPSPNLKHKSFQVALSLFRMHELRNNCSPQTLHILARAHSQIGLIPRLIDLLLSPDSPLRVLNKSPLSPLPPVVLFNRGPSSSLHKFVFPSEQKALLTIDPEQLRALGVTVTDHHSEMITAVFEILTDSIVTSPLSPFEPAQNDLKIPTLDKMLKGIPFSNWLQSELLRQPKARYQTYALLALCSPSPTFTELSPTVFFDALSTLVCSEKADREQQVLMLHLIDVLEIASQPHDPPDSHHPGALTAFSSIIRTSSGCATLERTLLQAISVLPTIQQFCFEPSVLNYLIGALIDPKAARHATSIFLTLLHSEPELNPNRQGHLNDPSSFYDTVIPIECQERFDEMLKQSPRVIPPSTTQSDLVNLSLPFVFTHLPPSTQNHSEQLNERSVKFISSVFEYLKTESGYESSKMELATEKLHFSGLVSFVASLVCSSRNSQETIKNLDVHSSLLSDLLISFGLEEEHEDNEQRVSILEHNLSILLLFLHLSKSADCPEVPIRSVMRLLPPTQILKVLHTAKRTSSKGDTLELYISVILSLLLVHLQHNPLDFVTIFPEHEPLEEDDTTDQNHNDSQRGFAITLLDCLSELNLSPSQSRCWSLFVLLQTQLIHRAIAGLLTATPSGPSTDESKLSMSNVSNYFSSIVRLITPSSSPQSQKNQNLSLVIQNFISCLVFTSSLQHLHINSHPDLSFLQSDSEPFAFCNLVASDLTTPMILSSSTSTLPQTTCQILEADFSSHNPVQDFLAKIKRSGNQNFAREYEEFRETLFKIRTKSLESNSEADQNVYPSLQYLLVVNLTSVINSIDDEDFITEFWLNLAIHTTQHFTPSHQGLMFRTAADLLPHLSQGRPQLFWKIVETIERHFASSWEHSKHKTTSTPSANPFLNPVAISHCPRPSGRIFYLFAPEFEIALNKYSDAQADEAYQSYLQFLRVILALCGQRLEEPRAILQNARITFRLLNWILYLSTPLSDEHTSIKNEDNLDFRGYFSHLSENLRKDGKVETVISPLLARIVSVFANNKNTDPVHEIDSLIWSILLLARSPLIFSLHPEAPTEKLRPFTSFISPSILTYLFPRYPEMTLVLLLKNLLDLPPNPDNKVDIIQHCLVLQYFPPAVFASSKQPPTEQHIDEIIAFLSHSEADDSQLKLAQNALLRIRQFPTAGPLQPEKVHIKFSQSDLISSKVFPRLEHNTKYLISLLIRFASCEIDEHELTTHLAPIIDSKRQFLLFKEILESNSSLQWKTVQAWTKHLSSTNDTLFDTLFSVISFQTDLPIPPIPTDIDQFQKKPNVRMDVKAAIGNLGTVISTIIIAWSGITLDDCSLSTINDFNSKFPHVFHDMHETFSELERTYIASFSQWLLTTVEHKQFPPTVAPVFLDSLSQIHRNLKRFLAPVPPQLFATIINQNKNFFDAKVVEESLSIVQSLTTLFQILRDIATLGALEDDNLLQAIAACEWFNDVPVLQYHYYLLEFEQPEIEKWKAVLSSSEKIELTRDSRNRCLALLETLTRVQPPTLPKSLDLQIPDKPSPFKHKATIQEFKTAFDDVDTVLRKNPPQPFKDSLKILTRDRPNLIPSFYPLVAGTKDQLLEWKNAFEHLALAQTMKDIIVSLLMRLTESQPPQLESLNTIVAHLQDFKNGKAHTPEQGPQQASPTIITKIGQFFRGKEQPPQPAENTDSSQLITLQVTLQNFSQESQDKIVPLLDLLVHLFQQISEESSHPTFPPRSFSSLISRFSDERIKSVELSYVLRPIHQLLKQLTDALTQHPLSPVFGEPVTLLKRLSNLPSPQGFSWNDISTQKGKTLECRERINQCNKAMKDLCATATTLVKEGRYPSIFLLLIDPCFSTLTADDIDHLEQNANKKLEALSQSVASHPLSPHPILVLLSECLNSIRTKLPQPAPSQGNKKRRKH